MTVPAKATIGSGFGGGGDPKNFESNGELPAYLVGADADALGRRIPTTTVSPLPSPYVGGVGLSPSTLPSPGFPAAQASPASAYSVRSTQANSSNAWREGTEDMRRLRARNVILIERMLSSHQPHDVLTQVPENFNWHSKTFTLAVKIERLMFASATTKENYLDESTLRSRVQLLSRHLVRIRKRKNAMASAYAAGA